MHTQTERQEAYRARKTAREEVEVRVWVPKDRRDELRAFAAAMRESND